VPERSLQRILVALDASAHGRAALEAAVILAADLQADLLGLFVEDANLLRLAALPFTRTAHWGPGQQEPMDERRMARVLRAEAEQLRRLFAAEAGRLHVRCTFEVTRGPVDEALLAAAERVDLVVMGAAGRNPMTGAGLGSTARAMARSAPRSVAFLSPGSRPGRPVVTFYDGAGEAERALTLAGRLAREDGQNLVVLIPRPLAGPEGALDREVEDRLAREGLRARLRHVSGGDAEGLAREVRAVNGRLLVLRAGHPLCEASSLATLLARAGCPVVIAR
jgi:nucleotide-binding universal stress UspA family protein